MKVVVLTRHSDCAAEKIAADPEKRAQYPALAAGVDARDAEIRQFLARPLIAERIARGELLVKVVSIDTASNHFVE